MSQLSDQKNSLFGKPKGPNDKTTTSSTIRQSPTTTTAKPISKTTSTTSTNKNSNGIVLSPAVIARKLEEAKEESAIGMRCLKKSVFQWSADHLGAAPHFETSSHGYKAAGEINLAHMMMVQSANSHDGADCQGAAAVSLMKAAVLAQLMNRPDLSAADYERAAEMWGSHGHPDKCAEMIAKAACALAETQHDRALLLYKQAIDMIVPPETPASQMAQINVKGIEMMREAIAFMLRPPTESIKDGTALAYTERQCKLFEAFDMESAMCKAMCSVTIIQLSMNDTVSADHTFLDHLSNKQYIVSRECRLAESFIMAMKSHDLDMLDEAHKNPDLNYLDREVTILAKNLSLYANNEGVKKKNKEKNAEKELQDMADLVEEDLKDMMVMAPKDVTEGDQEEEECYSNNKQSNLHEEYDSNKERIEDNNGDDEDENEDEDELDLS